MTPPSIPNGLRLVDFAQKNNLLISAEEKENAKNELKEKFSSALSPKDMEKFFEKGLTRRKFNSKFAQAFHENMFNDIFGYDCLAMFNTNNDKRVTFDELVENYAILREISDLDTNETTREGDSYRLFNTVRFMHKKVELYNELAGYTDKPEALLNALQLGKPTKAGKNVEKTYNRVGGVTNDRTDDLKFDISGAQYAIRQLRHMEDDFSNREINLLKTVLAETIGERQGIPKITEEDGTVTLSYEHVHDGYANFRGNEEQTPRFLKLWKHGKNYTFNPRKGIKGEKGHIGSKELMALEPSDYSTKVRGIKVNPLMNGDEPQYVKNARGGRLIKDFNSYITSEDDVIAIANQTATTLLEESKSVRSELDTLWKGMAEYTMPLGKSDGVTIRRSQVGALKNQLQTVLNTMTKELKLPETTVELVQGNQFTSYYDQQDNTI